MPIIRSRSPSAWLLLALCSSGCLPAPRDISDETHVRSLGLIGRCVMLREDTPLIELGKPYPRLALREPPVQPAKGGPGRPVGTVRAGTRVRVLRAEHAVTYWDGFFSIESELALGRIESGEHAGKVADMYWGVLPGRDDDLRPYVACPPGE
jgi:hypothetical protein